MMRKGILALALAAGAALWGTTAEAHPPIGLRVAAGGARTAYRATRVAARVPVRTAAVAGRAYYRAATTPVYSPYGVYRAPVYAPAYRPVVGYRASFSHGVGYGGGYRGYGYGGGYGCY